MRTFLWFIIIKKESHLFDLEHDQAFKLIIICLDFDSWSQFLVLKINTD